MTAQEANAILERLGVATPDAGDLIARSPIDGSELAKLSSSTPEEVAATVAAAHKAFLAWRSIPAPRRGELVRLLGEELRAHKDDLAALVTLEAG